MGAKLSRKFPEQIEQGIVLYAKGDVLHEQTPPGAIAPPPSKRGALENGKQAPSLRGLSAAQPLTGGD